ncbi:MAG: 3-oxoacyl-ACP reductase [Acidiferrobacteraceae bacterium]|mgnify:FL=1|jgi:3-oxoacyl-[acyl-carrier protein] reductase|nr:3-oxoacyl-ACP reductase [Acidiferrobacteraceae bacterium]MDP6123497.1 3-oxoacyl-ACP reductase FabG [Arenicellales bacterium]MDP6435396.1 3-oxoacyl-ACP reductase FabG [Arenicellales bacterium]MDP6672492.1 3-oxoacyl-ACP reductase FabG [Arenicellales bacterium]MDP6723641.1 3-oxoacyl-ACP reductase FabG [Arenicellales bacterium]|tara:strand:- start:4920 stop:5663 length:744 start_codon:yes stop_codon:yes gene_type:complete
MSLENQICLVTGATRGIGKAIILELGRLGGTVFGTATSESGAELISNTLLENQIEGQGMVLNVTDPDSLAAVIEQMKESFGMPLVVVNNAGITRDNLLMRMKDEDWDALMETNLKSVYRVSKACLRSMTKARFGRIINVTSVVGVSGNPGQTNYSAAKAGVIGFTKSLAQEVAGRNITVNTVAPGFIDTDMTRSLGDDQREALLQRIPAGRLGQPEDIASAVGYLATPEASYITGATLHVNGGMYMQ